jgi:hypothetical protein
MVYPFQSYRLRGGTSMKYEAPVVIDFGSISDHTFQTPGHGTKSGNTTFVTDKFQEFSHPASSTH